MNQGTVSVGSPSVPAWLRELKTGSGEFIAMLNSADPSSGYCDTVREISQQPATWSDSARNLVEVRATFAESLASCKRVVLTGSGSSQYAGECAAPSLENDLKLPVEVVGGGELLLRRRASVAGEPTLAVHLARSGDSPESAAVVETLLETESNTRHLIITCNAEGRLAKEYRTHSRVNVVDLGSLVNDRSLVMTSSFTNLVLGARFLGWVNRPEQFVAMVDQLDRAGRKFLTQWPDCLEAWISGPVNRIVFLGNTGRFGACREGALKVLEMTSGRMASMSQTFLGVRHGPMSFIDERTLLVCYVSTDPLLRKYERDLILELNAKGLGARKLIAGVGDPGADLCREEDLLIRYDVPEQAADDGLALLDVMVAQILGFHRSLKEGLKPDSPSASGVISRVVGKFRIHRAAETE
jgi:tagatose-6-phosphate ketose/aldose isomerase